MVHDECTTLRLLLDIITVSAISCATNQLRVLVSRIRGRTPGLCTAVRHAVLIGMQTYRNNHYVPEWYQYRFLPPTTAEKKFYYLDLKPETKFSNGRPYKRKDLLRWGPKSCFAQNDLYTTRFGSWESTEIEEKFFGKVDASAQAALDYFADFQHPSVDSDAFHALLPYMSIQKLRTPKGLAHFARTIGTQNKNLALIALQDLQQLYCAVWTECIWSIADASDSSTKFLVSDHPVTVYNRACFPHSKWCVYFNDPDIWLSATHTLFPLSLDKILILTNLSWVRHPYGNPLKPRPNSAPFRPAMFNFQEIQTGRKLSEVEVNEINFIIKKRAYRYIAAAEKDWLYPEKNIGGLRWDKLGGGYLLMPDPRSVIFAGEFLIGYKGGGGDAFDVYGRKPWQKGYDDRALHDREWETFHAFQGEFARLYGPRRRGQAYEMGRLSPDEDSPDYHAYHLRLEQTNRKFHYKAK